MDHRSGGRVEREEQLNPNPHPNRNVRENGLRLGESGEREREQAPARDCPRCYSNNTKFCYFNNYSLDQPRYFCRDCRRHWTHGGTLRNVPIGGASRKSTNQTNNAPQTSIIQTNNKSFNGSFTTPTTGRQFSSVLAMQTPNYDQTLGMFHVVRFSSPTPSYQPPNQEALRPFLMMDMGADSSSFCYQGNLILNDNINDDNNDNNINHGNYDNDDGVGHDQLNVDFLMDSAWNG